MLDSSTRDDETKETSGHVAPYTSNHWVIPAFLLDEETGKVLFDLPATPNLGRNDMLHGLIYWSGERLISRSDSFHGPGHGGRHPWQHWQLQKNELNLLPGKMDLSEFANGYEVAMEAPMVAGLIFERTEFGSVVCYDLRAK